MCGDGVRIPVSLCLPDLHHTYLFGKVEPLLALVGFVTGWVGGSPAVGQLVGCGGLVWDPVRTGRKGMAMSSYDW